jgi:hypothetical protein
MTLKLLASLCCFTFACGTEPSGELVLDRADDTGVVGEFRDGDATIRFDSRLVGDTIAAALFDGNGIRIAAQYPGQPPREWGDVASEERTPDAAALMLLPDVAAALARADLGTAEATTLITLANPDAGDDETPAPTKDTSYGRCDNYVERTAFSYTNYPCHQALSWLQSHYAECSAWIQSSWFYKNYQTGLTNYYCTAAAIY